VTAAEKRLAQATAAVEDARARMAGLEVERNSLQSEVGAVDAGIRQAIYSATTDGKTVDVSGDRKRLEGLRERGEMMEPVAAALQDGVRRAEQARDRVISDLFPELRAGLEAEAAKVRVERDQMRAHQAEEEARVDAKVGDLDRRWRDLVRPLPGPVRPGDMTDDLELPMTEPDASLGIYVAEPHWPQWAVAILEQSRQIRAQAAPIGVPFG
jgi:hypothetical protein